MTDVSDGLIADLGHIAEASKVRIDVASGKVDIPSQMNDIGQAVGVDPSSGSSPAARTTPSSPPSPPT